MIGTAESYSLLSKIAEKLMKTYGDIKIMCDEGLQSYQNQQITQGLDNKNNARIQNQLVQTTITNTTPVMISKQKAPQESKKSFQPKTIQVKSVQKLQKVQNQLPVNMPRKIQTSSNLKNSDQSKQKIGNNMNRIQQKVMKLSSEQLKPKKTISTNSNPNTHPAYLIYFQERQPILSKKFPNLSITDICQKITEEWQAMDASKKVLYNKKQDNQKKNNNDSIRELKKNQSIKEDSNSISKSIPQNQKNTKGISVEDPNKKKQTSKKMEAVSEQESNFDYLNGDIVSDLQILDDIYNDQEEEEQSE